MKYNRALDCLVLALEAAAKGKADAAARHLAAAAKEPSAAKAVRILEASNARAHALTAKRKRVSASDMDDLNEYPLLAEDELLDEYEVDAEFDEDEEVDAEFDEEDEAEEITARARARGIRASRRKLRSTRIELKAEDEDADEEDEDADEEAEQSITATLRAMRARAAKRRR